MNYYKDKYAKARKFKEIHRLESPPPEYPKELKGFRRGVIAVNLDFDEYAILMKCDSSNWINCYRLTEGIIDDPDIIKIIKHLFTLIENPKVVNERIGWSKVLEYLRLKFKPVRAQLR